MSTISESELQGIVEKIVRQTLGERDVNFKNPSSTSERNEIQKPETHVRAIALGADHGGYSLKEILKSFLSKQGYHVDDCGTHSMESVDYPDFALAVAKKVSDKEAWRGIIIDGAGIGSCMVANKVSGVRAAMCYDTATALNSREHNDANVLTLGGGMIDHTSALQITLTWLNTLFAGGRHARRVDKIMEVERK
jgi:ribose 5-phosphate isomerase B